MPGLRYKFAENMMVKFKQKQWFLRRAVSNINLPPKNL
ncbi:hypothetical protein CSUNSWCD_1856 [Campylobacter showae CSUNSWCD]|uniref:Uncharacterized protein n=1 Tax=Campylobacter showae CSUNSWCD TaxID=1244083 RepID=M5IJX6_9BACT|nr:hypothetical protein CSUNSWCD_1856 [Campylobacter showae CSUNSWCD]